MLRVVDAAQRNVLGHDRRRQRLGDPVGHLVAGLAKLHPGGVFQRLLGFHRAEGDHLGDLVFAPTLGSVANHLVAATVVEVDIDIRRRGALGVEEALEEQAVLNGIDIGNRWRRPPETPAAEPRPGPTWMPMSRAWR